MLNVTGPAEADKVPLLLLSANDSGRHRPVRFHEVPERHWTRCQQRRSVRHETVF